MNDIFKNLPVYARNTKKKVTEAITEFNNEDSNYFYNEQFTNAKVLELLNSKYAQENL